MARREILSAAHPSRRRGDFHPRRHLCRRAWDLWQGQLGTRPGRLRARAVADRGRALLRQARSPAAGEVDRAAISRRLYFAVTWPSSSIVISTGLPLRVALAVQRYFVTGIFF